MIFILLYIALTSPEITSPRSGNSWQTSIQDLPLTLHTMPFPTTNYHAHATSIKCTVGLKHHLGFPHENPQGEVGETPILHIPWSSLPPWFVLLLLLKYRCCNVGDLEGEGSSDGGTRRKQEGNGKEELSVWEERQPEEGNISNGWAWLAHGWPNKPFLFLFLFFSFFWCYTYNLSYSWKKP